MFNVYRSLTIAVAALMLSQVPAARAGVVSPRPHGTATTVAVTAPAPAVTKTTVATPAAPTAVGQGPALASLVQQEFDPHTHANLGTVTINVVAGPDIASFNAAAILRLNQTTVASQTPPNSLLFVVDESNLRHATQTRQVLTLAQIPAVMQSFGITGFNQTNQLFTRQGAAAVGTHNTLFVPGGNDVNFILSQLIQAAALGLQGR